jgi:hypothetical protein
LAVRHDSDRDERISIVMALAGLIDRSKARRPGEFS